MQICTAEDTGRSIRVRAVCQTGWIENSRSDCVMGLMEGAELGDLREYERMRSGLDHLGQPRVMKQPGYPGLTRRRWT